MDKLKMQTVNKADENYKKLAEMFPNAVTEAIDENGEVVRAIDKDVLMQEINTRVVDGKEERYQFTWPDKKKSVLLANAPINKTLRPCREESVDFDNTENLYIEGDNLEVLKLLQETYLGKIKMIYIDPPYNTGNDFVYADDFAQSTDEYLENSGQFDDEGNRLVKNLDSNGRFHTDWLNMIYPRLKLAKDLLSEDGVIFISIDDNEDFNLKKCCDEVFGEMNFLAQCVRKRRDSQANLSKNISPIHEYVLIYAKRQGDILNKVAANIDENEYRNPDNDPRGPYKTMPCTNKGGAVYTVKTPTGKEITEEWRFKRETYDKLFADNRLVFPKGGEGKPRYKLFLYEKKEEGQLANTWLDNLASNQEATREIKSLFDDKLLFDTPKPIGLLEFCTQLSTQKDSIVLDFFSGSAATAHAVMQLNAEDGGHRKFIMVQLPEETEEKSEAYKAGYKNICEIGKERIRRAGKKIVEELSNCGKERQIEGMTLLSAGVAPSSRHAEWIDNTTGEIKAESRNAHAPEDYYKYNPEKLDIGFRVLKCDSSNMKEVYYTPDDYEMSLFDSLEDNIKEDRTPEDLLFQVMLDLGILLSSKIQVRSEKVGMRSYSYFDVEDGYLIACFDKDIDEEVITAIAKQKPYYFIMRDSSMANDSVATNFDQIFASYSPSTIRKVL